MTSRTRSRRWEGLAVAGWLALAAAGAPARALPAQEPAAGPPPPSSLEPLVPDTIFGPEGGPRVVVLHDPGSPLVSFRVSVPLREAPSEAGAGRLLATLAVLRARSMAGPVSARIEGGRTPEGIAYAVTGAVEDFDYLTYLVRVALAEPRPDRIDFQRAQSGLEEEARRAGETPSGRLARLLRERAFPGHPPLGGTLGSLAVITPRTLQQLWARTHQASRLTLVVAGDLPLELILLAPQGMGARDGAAPDAPTGQPPSTRATGTQVIRRWYGEAYRLPDPREPVGRIAAILVADRLRSAAGSFESFVELWEVDGGAALALMGAAYAGGESAMRQAIGTALGVAAGSVAPADVEAAVARVRRDLLFHARTPWGRSEVVGRHMAAADDPRAAERWLERLDAVTAASVRAYLTELASETPVRAEVRP